MSSRYYFDLGWKYQSFLCKDLLCFHRVEGHLWTSLPSFSFGTCSYLPPSPWNCPSQWPFPSFQPPWPPYFCVHPCSVCEFSVETCALGAFIRSVILDCAFTSNWCCPLRLLTIWISLSTSVPQQGQFPTCLYPSFLWHICFFFMACHPSFYPLVCLSSWTSSCLDNLCKRDFTDACALLTLPFLNMVWVSRHSAISFHPSFCCLSLDIMWPLWQRQFSRHFGRGWWGVRVDGLPRA